MRNVDSCEVEKEKQVENKRNDDATKMKCKIFVSKGVTSAALGKKVKNMMQTAQGETKRFSTEFWPRDRAVATN